VNALNHAIYQSISTDVPLIRDIPGGVHYAMRASGDALPMVIFAESAGIYRRTFPGAAWRDMTYLIKVVDEGYSIITAKNIDTALAKKFDGQELLLDGEWTTAVCHRTSDVIYQETINGRLFWHIGGLYQFGLRKQ